MFTSRIFFLFSAFLLIAIQYSYGQCTNSSSYGSATAAADNGVVTISTCNYQTEYSTVNGIASGETYEFAYDLGGCITVHEGSPSGPIVASGTTPVSYTATSNATLYIHYNTDCAGCGTATGCGTSTVTCTSCPPPPPPPANTGCGGMEPICTNTGLSFTANTGVSDADVLDPGNDYGCLFSQPNPTWYFFEISTAGTIDMSLSAPSDIDFIVWGPFADLAAAQAGCGTMGQPGGAPEVDCSYSATSNETPSIPNAQVGEVYVMLITNYANVTQTISLTQTSGGGATDCTILQPCAADAGPDLVYCPNDPNITIGADPVSPDDTDTYSWDNSAGSGTIDIANGENGQVTVSPSVTTDYVVTITDTSGCSDSDTMTVTIDNPPTASNPDTINVECASDVPAPNPAVVIDEADDVTPSPTVAHVSDVSDGNTCPEQITRTYSVTDDCGNSINVTQTIIIEDTTPPSASNPSNITVSCTSDVPAPDPSVVTDEADNCTVNPVVTWDNDQSDGNVCNNETITRTYLITDDCGNQSTVTQNITIEAITPSVDAGTDVEVCEGDMVTLSAHNPDNANISWDQGITDNVSFSPSLGTTTYTVTATICGGISAGGCENTDQVDVTSHAIPVVSFMADTTIGCEGLEVEFTNTSTEQYDCNWDFGNGIVVDDCGTQTIQYDQPGTYDVSLTVSNAIGCSSSDQYSAYIEVVENPDASFNVSSSVVFIDDTRVIFSNNSTASTSYVWDFGDNTASSNESEPIHYFPDSKAGNYEVILTAYNDLGCYDSAFYNIKVEEVLIYYVPNTFTPDGDQFNESFKPVFKEGFDYYDFHLMIFNKWGEVIFESYNSDKGWDGTYGDGGLVPDGVYIWQIDFGDKTSDKRRTVRGHVTVLK